MKNLIFLFSLIIPFTVFSQIRDNNQSRPTIEQIMQEPEKWIGSLPENSYWGEQGENIYFNWNPEQDTLASLYSYSLKNGEIEQVSTDVKKELPGRRGSYNTDKTKKVFTRNGNLFLYNIKTDKEKQLTNWLQRASSPDFALDETHISFMMNQNLFLLNLKTGEIKQVTNFTSGQEKPDKKSKGQAKWLENQQKELFSVLNEREAKQKARENRREKEAPEQPEKIYLGKNRVGTAALSPSGKYVIYSTYQRPENATSTSVTHFVTEDGYTRNSDARSKVGSPETKATIGIFDVENNKTIEVKTSAIPGLKDLPEFIYEYPDQVPEDTAKIEKREFNLVGPQWHGEKDVAVVVALSLDNKDRWIMLLHPKYGEMELLNRQRDEARIAGPGIGGYSISAGKIGWMPDGRSVWFHSEESGYSHLYAVNIETKEKKALTSGAFEVSDAFISNNKKHFYFTANKVHPGVKHFYRMPVEGGELTQITSMEGNNDVLLSPDEKNLAIRYSYANQPWELYLQKNKAGAEAERITHSTTDDFENYDWRVPEFITFEAKDAAEVHARLYRPEKPENNGPAVIFVHGAGYLQNAHKWWSSYFREYMFHNILTDNGYTVLDIDYRGSAGYGRDWRTGIYRHMGGKDLSDQVDGAKMLVDKYNVSPEKIGIYGGSYGGFITLMALFTEPEVFAAGGALRSVTDWAHYNHGYTSNILNTPVEDSIAFVRSSPIYFAEGLQGALLMCHGMVDDNVQFQDIVRLSQRLIELGKENWELAVYPVEPHGFREPSSWTDEYKRIYKLFEENLRE